MPLAYIHLVQPPVISKPDMAQHEYGPRGGLAEAGSRLPALLCSKQQHIGLQAGAPTVAGPAAGRLPALLRALRALP